MAKGSTVGQLFLYALYAAMAYGLYMFWKSNADSCKKVGGHLRQAGNEAYTEYIRPWRVRDPNQRA